jgi:hypothetical protein
MCPFLMLGLKLDKTVRSLPLWAVPLTLNELIPRVMFRQVSGVGPGLGWMPWQSSNILATIENRMLVITVRMTRGTTFFAISLFTTDWKDLTLWRLFRRVCTLLFCCHVDFERGTFLFNNLPHEKCQKSRKLLLHFIDPSLYHQKHAKNMPIITKSLRFLILKAEHKRTRPIASATERALTWGGHCQIGI